jgi:uncharacterized protein
VILSTDQMQQYVVAARERQRRRSLKLKQRRADGLTIARQAAQILKSEFQAVRVVVFGSLIHQTFHETSDIDLAVWGLPERCYFQAVGRLLALSHFAMDLVEVQFASPEILAAIEQGQDL